MTLSTKNKKEIHEIEVIGVLTERLDVESSSTVYAC